MLLFTGKIKKNQRKFAASLVYKIDEIITFFRSEKIGQYEAAYRMLNVT